jgi:phage shock protein A
MRPLLLAAALSLAGCEQKTWTRDEIADIAADSADAGLASEVYTQASDLDGRVSELESENQRLESELSTLAARVSEMESHTHY